MQKDQQKLIELIKGKKVAFIGAGVSHKTLIKEFVFFSGSGGGL